MYGLNSGCSVTQVHQRLIMNLFARGNDTVLHGEGQHGGVSSLAPALSTLALASVPPILILYLQAACSATTATQL